MTHDLLEEHPIPLRGVPKLKEIGPRRSGTRLDIRTVARWATKGVCGVVLETVVQGSQRYTSVPAVCRFFAAVTVAKQRRGGNEVPTRKEVKPALARVESELDRLGI